MSEIGALIADYGFPIVMMVGLGYFIYYIWWFVGEKLEPEIEKQHLALTVSYTHLTLPTKRIV